MPAETGSKTLAFPVLRSVLIVVLLISAGARAQAECTLGTGCDCTGGTTCTCQDQCSFDCASGTCSFGSPGTVSIDCDENSTCSSTIDGGARFDCEQAATCQLTAGGAVDATCARQAICSLSVGGGSTVRCSPGVTSCSVDCAGDCHLTCAGPTCSLSCASGAQPSSCGDGGVRSCGACPTDGGVDAGPSPSADAGTELDAGVGEQPRLEPWSLKVGCSSVTLAPLTLAALALLRRRAR